MKKLLVALALLTVSTVGYADDEVKVVPMDRVSASDGERWEQGIVIVDGKSVYYCRYGSYSKGCVSIADDYTKETREKLR